MTHSTNYTLYFDDPRLRMSPAGRFLTRVATGISYLFLLALTTLLLLSDVQGLQFAGLLLLLFWADRLLHYKEADEDLSEVKTEDGLNIGHYLSPAAFRSLERAVMIGGMTHHHFYIALMKELLHDAQVQDVLTRLELDQKIIREKIDSWLAQKVEPNDNPYEITITSPMLTEAFHRARANHHRSIHPGDLLAGLFTTKDPYIERLARLFEITPEGISEALLLSHAVAKSRPSPERRFQSKKNVINRSWTSRATPTLDHFSRDLSDLASQGIIGELVGHKEEYEAMLQALTRKINPNALLVGVASVGKDTLVEHLAAEIIHDRVPEGLADRRIIELHIPSLIANASAEELQGRIQKIVEESLSAGNIILYIPRLHDLIHTSGAGHLSAIDALAPVFEKEALPVIGSTRPQEFKQFLEPRADILAYFEKITVEEISIEDAFLFLTQEAKALEAASGVTIGVAALKKSVVVAKQYLHHRPLPGNALELLRESVDAVRAQKKRVLNPEDVARVAESKVHIPIHRPEKEEVDALLHFEEIIHRQFIDQEEAVKSVADALREYRSGLTRKGGPIASLLFVGPTGVGKTALSKLIAELQFGSKDLLIRFDMSEYQDKKSFERFIGSPDGTILGALTEAVREKPRSVILLDEFEKAFPDILHLFLQVFDEGRLTDGLGREVSFEDAVLVATSNAHSKDIEEGLAAGRSMAQIADHFKEKMVDVFTPELLNRFSKIIVFKNLSPEDIKKITELELQSLVATMKEKDLTLVFESDVIKKIATLGYDPSFGARPLRQAIEEHIRAPLAKELLENKFGPGDTIQAKLEGEIISFIKKAAK